MAATIIDTDALLKVVGAAFAAGIGITVLFSFVIVTATRSDELRRAGNPAGAALFGIVAAIGVLAVGIAVVVGLRVMTTK